MDEVGYGSTEDPQDLRCAVDIASIRWEIRQCHLAMNSAVQQIHFELYIIIVE